MISVRSRKVILDVKTETQPSTIDYYHEKRKELIEKVSGGVCEKDECIEDRAEKLHFHHVEPIEESDREGGWQHLYRIKEDLENGIEIEVLCTHHHIKEHRERTDLTPLTRFEG